MAGNGGKGAEVRPQYVQSYRAESRSGLGEEERALEARTVGNPTVTVSKAVVIGAGGRSGVPVGIQYV